MLMRVHGGVGCTNAVGPVRGRPFNGVVENKGHVVARLDANSGELFANGGGKTAELL